MLPVYRTPAVYVELNIGLITTHLTHNFFKFHIMHFHISDSQELEQDEDAEDSRGIGGNDMCFSKCVYWGKVDKLAGVLLDLNSLARLPRSRSALTNSRSLTRSVCGSSLKQKNLDEVSLLKLKIPGLDNPMWLPRRGIVE